MRSFIHASGSFSNINVWNLNTRRVYRDKQLKGHSDFVRHIHACHRQPERIISCSDDCSIRLWNIQEGICLKTFVGHTEPVTKVVYFNEDVLCSISEDQRLKFWHVDERYCRKTLYKQVSDITAWINDIWILRDGSIVTVGKDACVNFWEGFT